MIHLELQPEIEAQLTADAQSLGVSTEKYVEQILHDRIPADDESLRRASTI